MHDPERAKASRWAVCLALGLPVLVAIALLTPRILDAHFGLFDDPKSVTIAEQTWAGTWDWRADFGQYGRFRPVYWLSFSLLYGLAGGEPVWHFVANLVLLAGTAFLLGSIVLRLTRRPLAAGITGVAFVLGGPAIEATYTLSKPELLQCFLLTASGAVLVLPRRGSSRGVRGVRVLLAAGFILLAALTKETTGLALPIAAVWLLLAWLGKRAAWRTGFQQPLPNLVDFLLSAALGVGLYVAGALALSPTTISGAGPRANFTFTLDTIVGNWRVWQDWIVRDWLYLVALGIPILLLIIWRRKLSLGPLIVGCVVWMGAWFAIYLPYRFTPEYYLLPFSLGAAVLAGVLTIVVADAARAPGRPMRLLAGACAALAAFLMALTIPNNVSNAGIQLAVDRANAEMLRHVAEEAPQGALVLVNIRWEIEYRWQLEPMLQLVYDRPDLTVIPYETWGDTPPAPGTPVMVLSPLIENVPVQKVRLGIPELESRKWEASLQEELNGSLSLLREVRAETHLLMVDAPRLVCLAVPQIGYCQAAHTPFDTRRFAEGWRIYAVESASG